MVTTLNLTAEVPLDREVTIKLPNDVPPGPAEIVVMVSPRGSASAHTLGDLLRSEFFGMWKDRTDIEDSAAFAHRLRAEAWSRSA